MGLKKKKKIDMHFINKKAFVFLKYSFFIIKEVMFNTSYLTLLVTTGNIVTLGGGLCFVCS